MAACTLCLYGPGTGFVVVVAVLDIVLKINRLHFMHVTEMAKLYQ